MPFPLGVAQPFRISVMGRAHVEMLGKDNAVPLLLKHRRKPLHPTKRAGFQVQRRHFRNRLRVGTEHPLRYYSRKFR